MEEKSASTDAVLKMELMRAGLVFLMLCFVESRFRLRGGRVFVKDAFSEWNRMETLVKKDLIRAHAPKSSDGNISTLPVHQQVIPYIVVSASNELKEAFKPEKGNRDLPDLVEELLKQATATTAAPPSSGGRKQTVEILCHIDRIYVRIKRVFFKVRNVFQNLKLGTCAVNKNTDEHYYFLYLLTADCGFQITSNVDDFKIDIDLHYAPLGPVIREIPFDLHLQCKYPRFFHSFKVGFHPIVKGGTVHKLLKKCSFTLSAQDETGKEMTGNDSITLGQTIHFEAKTSEGAGIPGNERIYIMKCYMTSLKDPNSEPTYTVIDKGGCMVDGVVSDHSKFLTSNSKLVQRFTMPAVAFDTNSPSSIKKLYMHCQIAVGHENATESHKTCNYDPANKSWKELYGDSSVCACCDSTCAFKQSKASRNIISTRSWNVDLSKNEHADIDFSLEDQGVDEHGDFPSTLETDD